MSNRFKALAVAVAIISLPALMGADGGCGGPPILDNNGFDLWCGNQLCYWEVEAGDVVKAPTWHRSDFGAEFIGPLAAISQHSDIGSETDCLRFSAVANIELGAIVTVEVDFFDDGTYDVAQRVPTSEWARIEFELPTPEAFRGARFRVRKEGSGQAILAEVQVTRSDKCVEAPIVIEDLPLGSACAESDQCASGVCLSVDLFGPKFCRECAFAPDCGEGLACGVADPMDPNEPLGAECGEPGRHSLGERCITNFECDSQICCDGVCSSCCPDGRDGDCVDTTCQRTLPDVEALPDAPHMCDGSTGGFDSGELCFGDNQCTSGTCDGTAFSVCLADGRVCNGISDCEGSSECVNFGVADGTCQ